MRPCIAMCVGHMANSHQGEEQGEQSVRVRRQRSVAMVSEMIHTASLVHDDILDHAETRRGKPSINVKWDIRYLTLLILILSLEYLVSGGPPWRETPS